MNTDAQFGTRSDDLELMRNLLQEALGVTFRLHDSSFLGGDYYRGVGLGDEIFKVFRNWDPNYKEAVTGSAEFKVVLRVESSKRLSEIEARLKSAVPGLERMT